MDVNFNGKVGGAPQLNQVNSNATVKEIKDPALDGFDAKLKTEAPDADEVTFKAKEGLSTEEKQAIMKKARKTAAGWSILGNIFSTAYYALRSDKTVAKKYGLDVENDKELIKNIKRQQTMQTIPSVLMPSGGGIIAFAYNALKNPAKLNVEG